MQEFESYLEKLFSDPGFAVFLGLVSLWYSFYLYRLPQRSTSLLFMTMSNREKDNPRQTTFVIINNSNKDIVKADLLNGLPLKIIFNDTLSVTDFTITYNSFKRGRCDLLQNSKNEFQLDFDIIKRKQAIALIATHDSKKHMDQTWKDIQIDGILINIEINRDDFSDQMIYRVRNVEIGAYLGAALLAIFASFSTRAFLKPLDINVPYGYLFIGSFFVCFIPVYNYFAGRVGENNYKEFWRVLKKSSQK